MHQTEIVSTNPSSNSISNTEPKAMPPEPTMLRSHLAYWFTAESLLQTNYSKGQEKTASNITSYGSSPTQSIYFWISTTAQQQQIKFDVLYHMVTKRPGKECIKHQMLWIFFNQSLYYWISTSAQPQQIKFDGLYQMVTKRPGKECIKFRLLWIAFY